MSGNVPDDWNSYWNKCLRGHSWHGSEGGCDQCAEMLDNLADAVQLICDEAVQKLQGDELVRARELLEQAHDMTGGRRD